MCPEQQPKEQPAMLQVTAGKKYCTQAHYFVEMLKMSQVQAGITQLAVAMLKTTYL